MCISCLDFIKGDINLKEFVRNFDEIDPVGVPEKHPDLEKAITKLMKEAAAGKFVG